ncbi:MAG: sigma 54-interacting transcriptional regulator [Desulfobacterium sp.]|nr:sigma 54-interacting transcriptional regulator [Desulfobacterium sp.]
MKTNKHLIMIIDDSPTNINILAGTLKDEFRLTIAKSGQTAFERLGQQLPDLILLDIIMPEMNGFEICRRLKADDRTREIPIIFITAMEEANKKTKGFELGAVDYITRPFHMAEVLARVRTHLSLRQMHLTLGEKNRIIRKTLAEKSRQLDVLISHLPGIVYRCRFDGTWHMEFISDGCRNLTGYEPDHFTAQEGQPYTLMAAPKYRPLIKKELDHALANHASFELIYRVRTASDRGKWFLEQGVGVYNPAGELIGTEGFISDVTEKHNKALALDRENQQLKSKIIQHDRFGDIVGKSPAMLAVYELILKAAAGDDCAIIYGPSGTGKEIVAKEIHKNSKRKQNAFIPINCGAIPESLFESEFFGHKKGAFSGANTDKKGVLDLADGGTLFLDELGEISLSMQVKLLRVMDGNGYIPVGGTELKKPDIRFVCATNQDLQLMVRQKKIREDFFFRIHIIPITLPPLKDRKEDIPLLVEHFLNSFPKTENTPRLTREKIAEMASFSWPGNIRQLQNVIYQFLTLGTLEFLDPGNRNRNIHQSGVGKEQTLKTAVEEFEKSYISRMLDAHGQKKGKVAEVLNMDRKTLFRKIKKYGL